jgi:serine/threonine protein kinase
MPRLVFNGSEFPLTSEAELILGRHRENDIPLPDGKASRRHARVFCKKDGTVWVEDLESANGTLVNDEEIFTPRKLIDGDQIVIGKAKIRFLGDTVETTPENGVTVIEDDPKMLLDKIVGGCRLLSIIGSGPQGTVYRARQMSLGREVAVKIFHAGFIKRDPEFVDRFMTEARQSGRVQHHHVVKVHECGHDDGMLWYSMELVEGDTLEDLLARDGKLAPQLATIIIEQAAQALKAAHGLGVYHGDVHPGTLMLSREGKIKLLDLGLVRVVHASRSAGGKKKVVGNPWYMSPERAQGEMGDARSDIYSLGCIYYHLLAGEPPFHDDSPKAILKAQLEQPIPNIAEKISTSPKKIDEFIHSMLAKNPAWRFASMEEVLQDIAQVKIAWAQQTQNAEKEAHATKNRNDGYGSDRSKGHPGQNNERAQARVNKQSAKRASRAVWWVSIFALIGVAYLFSGISFSPILHGSKNDQSEKETHGSGQPSHVNHEQPVISAANNTNLNQANSNSGAPQGQPAPNTQPASAWKNVQNEIAEHMKNNNWGAAELRLNRFAESDLAKADAELIRAKREHLHVAGDTWYRQQITNLPDANDPAKTAPRLARLSELRDVSLSRNRADAESRYQELITKLDQQLRHARRQARHAVEEGKLDELSRLSKTLEPWFINTPIVGVYRQFAALTKEASTAKSLWQTQWQATKEKLLTARGEPALAAGAALLLAGYSDEARKLLLNDPALASGEFVRRREALFGREAAILSFSDFADLQYIETLVGEVRLVDGVLTGVGQSACGFAIAVPVGGQQWQAGMQLTMKTPAKSDGQMVISIVKADVAELTLRIETNKLELAVHSAKGWENFSPTRPNDPLNIRFACRAGLLTVLINNEAIAEIKDARIPMHSQLRIECADTQWTVDELQVMSE